MADVGRAVLAEDVRKRGPAGTDAVEEVAHVVVELSRFAGAQGAAEVIVGVEPVLLARDGIVLQQVELLPVDLAAAPVDPPELALEAHAAGQAVAGP